MYEPLSSESLLKRGSCCNNNCINCPYKKNKIMSDKIEDVLYEAFRDGIKDEVISESTRLSKLKKYKYLEIGDRLEIAYNNIKEKYNGKDKQ
tara:strand:+ start:20 stop:295 length:276 start_codon:yes stop_codon:yes gene_type:complete